ncbi:MAG: hypothetical protein MI757_07640, partial [Pirellulales bacterium]|nr:hypothetical protein [Pirellulales bacterium]
IGGSVQARRTGLAHVIFNLMTMVGGLLLLSPYMTFVDRFAPEWRDSDPELVLVGFHTLFNFVGVIAVLPLTDRFARLIVRIAPEKGNPLTRRLDKKLRKDPEFAIGAVRATVGEIVTTVFEDLTLRLEGKARQSEFEADDVSAAIVETRDYLELVATDPALPSLNRTHRALIHILDHLARLSTRSASGKRLADVRRADRLRKDLQRVVTIARTVSKTPLAIDDETASELQAEYRVIKATEKPFRRDTIARAAAGEIDPDTAMKETDAARWLRRVGYHVWRVAHHLHTMSSANGKKSSQGVDRQYDHGRGPTE